MSEADLKTQMNQLIRGYWTTQAIFVAAELKIADLLADGPKHPEELGKLAGVEGDMLYRVLRALASIGIFAEDADGKFMLTPLAETLCGDSGQRAYARLHGQELYQSWAKLLDAVRTADAGFVKAFGMPAFEYFAKHPERGAVFDKAMTGHHGAEADPMLDAYDFSPFKDLVDVGGGNGSLLTAILNRHPHMRGVLFDLPRVVERARAAIEKADVAERCRLIGGSFLEAVPNGADVYLLRHVVHDWRDEDAAIILRNCRNVMKPDGKVLVVEIVVPAGNDPSFAKWMDLMMVTYGGKERSEKQYRSLFAQAGLRVTRVVPTKSPNSVIEGVQA
jgi:ubiquinone/menaquinone biosynthesis C-methylase UbiE